MTTRVFGDKLGFKAEGLQRKPAVPEAPGRFPVKTVLRIVLGLVAAFFVLKRFGIL